jgi:leucyl aminopeptidase (aminopeptidase T)
VKKILDAPLLGSRAMLNLTTLKSAREIIRNNIKLKPGETVLIITDSTKIPIADALSYPVIEVNDNFSKAKEEISMSIMVPRITGGLEPPKCVAHAMKLADVILIPTKSSMTFTAATREARNNARIGSMPNVTENMMIDGGLRGDFFDTMFLTNRVAEALEIGDEYHVTSSNGTDITFRRGKRRVFRDDGNLSEKGKLGNLPAGEACLAIVEDSTNGVLVIDRMGEIVTKGIRLTVKEGRIVKVGGEDRHVFEKSLESAKDREHLDVNIVAEFGVGTNAAAKYAECEVEAEKMYGTVHFGIGGNEPIGGTSKTSFHHDGLILDARLEVDHRLILEGRKFFV